MTIRIKNAKDAFKKDPLGSIEEIPNEDGIIVSIDIEDELLSANNGETVIESDIQNSSSVKEEKVASENVRLFQAYLKEVGVEPIFTPREELEVAAKIKSCESRARDIKITLEMLLGKIGKSGDEECINTQFNDSESMMKRVHQSLFIEKSKARSAKRHIALICAYSHKSKELKDKFIKANLRLVMVFVKRYLGCGFPVLDLIQEGNIGLMKAVDRFDYTKGYKFSTYAAWWIKQSMSKAISDQSRIIRVPTYVIENASKVHRVNRTLSEKNGGKTLPEEIAKTTGISLAGVKWILESNHSVFSLDIPFFKEGSTTLKEFIPDGNSLEADSVMSVTTLSKTLEEALSSLNPREQEILRMRFAIGYETEHTLHEVGKRFNLTRERIRQIERDALKKLKKSGIGVLLKSFLE